MMQKAQAKQYRDSLIEEHKGIANEAHLYDISAMEANLIGRISSVTHVIEDGSYDPINKRIRKITSIE